MKTHSLTRRFTITVLVLELSMGIAMVSIQAGHEWHIRTSAFQEMVQGRADKLFGAVEDAEDAEDNVALDTSSISFPPSDIYRVMDERGRLLGGSSRAVEFAPKDGWSDRKIGGEPYQVVQFHGVRLIDPDRPGGGTRHVVTVLYGARTDHMRHEFIEAIRFDSMILLGLIGLTALLMVWLLRRELSPLYELAGQAERVSASDWEFVTPMEARRLRELRPLAEAIEAALGRLQQSFEQQRRFTSDAAHELKTGIAIAKSSLQLLAMRPRSGEEYQQGLEVCLEDCRRLEQIVLEMLTYARVEHEGPMESHGACGLRACADEAVRQTEALAELRQVEVSLSGGPEMEVPLDRHDCLLLCSNLLINAVQHTVAGRGVAVSVRAEERQAVLTIQDEGEGIAEADLPHVFEPFYRPDASRDRKSGGTGLGLSICEGLCRRAGGEIVIESKVGEGTRVTVRLPMTLGVRGEPGTSVEEMETAR